MITILIACDPVNLTQAQQDALAQRAQWYVVNRRLGRVLVDLIGQREDLQWIFDRLAAAGLNPTLIAVFRHDTGQRIKGIVIDLTAWLTVAPDNPDGSRPVAFRPHHTWAGWALPVDVSEP